MAHLLRDAIRCGIASSYARRLLAAIDRENTSKATENVPSMRAHPSLVEPLTRREIQVLELLAQGLTNAEIGQRLYISLPTVKSHTRNLYGKLGVHSRKQAVDRARALNLLAS
jgi:LuxR family maltose regulon positive regulatory protein